MECALSSGVVVKVYNYSKRQELEVLVGSEVGKAINYPELTGLCQLGDQVLLNTTAIDLSLGTGGWHYVLAIHDQKRQLQGEGHIMKLRYTPLQGRVLSVEEEASPHHETMVAAKNIDGLIVAVGSLHSMLAPIVFVLRSICKPLRLAYLMSDGAALPLGFSNVVEELKKRNLLESTITFGHAFGGDLEAVNVYSALLAAKHVVKADMAIILMGPGVVGTNTTYGTTALEQGVFLNAVTQLGGIPVAVPRLSEADSRERHLGLSHHTETVLNRLVNQSVHLPLPEKLRTIPKALDEINKLNHFIRWEKTEEGLNLLKEETLPLTTMGRGLDEDPLFFHGLVATALTMVALSKGES